MDIKITVIIPVHNSEKYLRGCIESALAQTFKDAEFLCIDGGSTDSSLDIIKEYRNKDSRIVCIHDPNTSYGHKINMGIKHAKGNYVAILESDDRMMPDMLENLYDIAEKYSVDIADGDYYDICTWREKEYRIPARKYENAKLYNRVICGKDVLNKGMAKSGIWTALYRKSFLQDQNIFLNESPGASYQDTSFLFLTALLAESVYHSDISCYRYRIDNVGSSVKDDKKIFEIADEFAFLKEELEKRGVEEKSVWNLYYTRKYDCYDYKYSRLSHSGREQFLVRYQKELEADVESGHICRENAKGYLYDCTFLLLDDRARFTERQPMLYVRTWGDELNDVLEQAGEENMVIFGAGQVGKRITGLMQQHANHVQVVCDNSSQLQGMKIEGVPVISVGAAVSRFPDAVYVIANRKNAEEMKSQLMRAGIEEKKIIIP